MRVISTSSFIGLIATLFTATAIAQADKAADLLSACPFAKGDSITKVKSHFGLQTEPVKFATSNTAGTTAYQYHLPAYGMYIFFDTSLQVQSLRFEAPYVGKIGGISVGMFLSELKQTRCEPVRPAYQGFLDSFDKQRKQEMRKQSVNELPDLVPKGQVIALVEELTKQLTAPPVFMQAYSFGNSASGGLWSRYDVSPTTDKVSIILSNSCS